MTAPALAPAPKRAKRISPTARSLAWLRSFGCYAEVVEKRLPIPGKFVTRDLFECIDIVAVSGASISGVQVTSGSNVATRLAKAERLAALVAWLRSGGVFEVHGWAKRGKRGERKLWTLRRVRAQLTREQAVAWHEVPEAGAREVGP